ncbi:MAG TPA: PKD domain-containing protein [Verrucomicrobiae bacterium]|nr:PKD domain-containing protein [Verrucomicrobiae bacterium]
MKRILGGLLLAVAVVLGTNAWAFTPGDIVVVRVGDGSQILTNTGNSVFLDEYQLTFTGPLTSPNWSIAFKGSTPMPTNWYGGQAPFLIDGGALAAGHLSLSTDGRFLALGGYAATFGLLTNSALSSATTTGSFGQVARVVGLVDGNDNVYTTTTITNSPENGDEIRSAVSLDGTNIWLAGVSGGTKYTKRGAFIPGVTPSGMSTQIETTVSNVRVLGIFSNQLYLTANNVIDVATNTSPAVNPLGGSLPTSFLSTNFVRLPGTFPNGASAFGFALFNLSGGPGMDTLYVTDSNANTNNSFGCVGGVWKYCLVGTQWVNDGSISACGAIGLTGKLSYSNSQPVVTLFITEGGTYTPANYNTLYPYIDLTGFNGDPGTNADGGDANQYRWNGVNPAFPNTTPAVRMNLRGVALVPSGGDSGTINSSGTITVGPPYGPSFLGPAGGAFSPSNGYVFSVANLSSTTTNSYYMTFAPSSGGNWLTFDGSTNALNPGTSTSITVLANNATATGEPGGTYAGRIVFHVLGGSTFGSPGATLTVQSLAFSPSSNFNAVGSGTLFTPSNYVYVVSNLTTTATAWAVGIDSNTDNSTAWATVTPSSGTLSSHASVPITVGINYGVASNLPFGVYADSLLVSNTTSTSLLTTEYLNLQVGFGFFDDFSQYQQGQPLVGQNGWTGESGSPDNPYYVSNNVLSIPFQCSGTTAQEPWKNISAQDVTDTTAYVYCGMMVAVTGAPSGDPDYSFAIYNHTFESGYADDRVGVSDLGGGNFEWDCHISGIDSWVHGGVPFGYNTTNMVIIVADVCNSNTWVVVNPTSANISYANVPANGGSSPPITTGQVAVQDPQAGNGPAGGAGADPTAGSFLIGNYCNGQSQSGMTISKLAVSTNFAIVYEFLTNVASSVTAPTASFTAAPTSGAAPLPVNFTDTSSGSPTAWYWTFDGVHTSVSQNPSFTYSTPGSYTAQLIASNSGGASSPATQTINVYDPYAWWRLQYFGSTNSANGAPSADPYGVGMSDTNKFLAGFNPTNSAAYLHIISVAKSSGNVVVTYLGASGDNTYTPGVASRTNVLEFATGTGNGSYTNNFFPTGQTNILSGGTGLGTQSSMTDTGGATNTPSRYYRVRVLLP